MVLTAVLDGLSGSLVENVLGSPCLCQLHWRLAPLRGRLCCFPDGDMMALCGTWVVVAACPYSCWKCGLFLHKCSKLPEDNQLLGGFGLHMSNIPGSVELDERTPSVGPVALCAARRRHSSLPSVSSWWQDIRPLVPGYTLLPGIAIPHCANPLGGPS